MNKDLTIGNPNELLFKFTMPMFISVLFQQMYTLADSIIAGQYAGENALAAIGASYPITMIFMAISIGFNIGSSVVISNLFGAKDYESLKSAISTMFITAFIASFVFTISGVVGTSWLMSFINTPIDIFQDGCLYLRIYILGFTFVFLYNISTGVFTSLGDSKTPLYFLIGSSIGNIILDYVLVVYYNLGVAGVAYATFIAQGIACILVLIALFHRLRSIVSNKYSYFSLSLLIRISKIAIPSVFQQSFISVGNFVIQRLINGYGSSVVAGYSAGLKLNTFLVTCCTTVGNAISSFTAQNLGAGKGDRVRSGLKAGLRISFGIAICIFLLFFVFSENVILLFLKEKSELALSTGVNFLRITSPFYLILCIKLSTDGVLRGSGRMKEFMIATFLDLILRCILAYTLSNYFGSIGIWWSWPLGWFVGVGLSVYFYRKGSYE